MKKIALMAGVIVTFCLTMEAQNNIQVNSTVIESFNEEFKGASNVTWEKVSKDIFLVWFNHERENSIAYFDYEGKLLISGKQISFNHAPLLIQNGLEDIIKVREKKNGKLSVINMYELIEDGQTKYYTNIGNNNSYLAVLSNNTGNTRILKNVKLDYKPENSTITTKK
jgi:hypothetical protein